MSELIGTHRGGMVLTFLAGAAAGAAVALLTAPQSGRDTRKKIKGFTEELATKASRVPPALQEACLRATEAGREAFVRALEESAVPAPSAVHSRQH